MFFPSRLFNKPADRPRRVTAQERSAGATFVSEVPQVEHYVHKGNHYQIQAAFAEEIDQNFAPYILANFELSDRLAVVD